MPLQIVKNDITEASADVIINAECGTLIAKSGNETFDIGCPKDLSEIKSLEACYKDALSFAVNHGFETVALPLIAFADKNVVLKTAINSIAETGIAIQNTSIHIMKYFLILYPKYLQEEIKAG